MQDLFVGIGLVLVIEGLLYALFPGGIRRMAKMAEQVPDQALRTGGVVALALGVLVVWLAR
jgi:uncharacterized protein YjeT (DUF2065 family)